MAYYTATVPVQCPTCGIKFNSFQLPVLKDTTRRNSELRQDFEGQYEQYEPYAICTCPSCGRADWMHTFPAIKETAVLDQPRTTPHLQFRAAAVGAEQIPGNYYSVGMFYLHAAWCADDARAYPQAREYRRLAADALYKSLLDVSCPYGERPIVEYLIGELHRKAGDFDKSRQHFNEVIPRLSAKYAFMARKLMKLASAGNMESIRFEA